MGKLKRSHTTIGVRSAISSNLPAALYMHNGDNLEIVDGLSGDCLRRLAAMLLRAAEHADESGDLNANYGAASFHMAFEIEWSDDTFSWETDTDTPASL